MVTKYQIAQRLRPEPERPAAFQQSFIQQIDPVQGWLSESESFLLWSASSVVPADSAIVEIGSYLGRSTVALAAGSTSADVYAVDPHTGDISEVLRGESVDTFDAFRTNLANAGVQDRVQALRMKSVQAAAEYAGPVIALLFIDGWHTADAVEEDVRAWLPMCSPECTVIFDDWPDAGVAEGITRTLALLPPVAGAIGKDLVFTNADSVRRLPIIRHAVGNERLRRAAARLGVAQDLLQPFR